MDINCTQTLQKIEKLDYTDASHLDATEACLLLGSLVSLVINWVLAFNEFFRSTKKVIVFI